MSTDYYARGTGQFLSGHDQQLGGFVDGMVPVLQKENRFLFIDTSIMWGQNQKATYSGGVGYRGMLNAQQDSLVGVYLFGEYYHSNFNTMQWLANPGL